MKSLLIFPSGLHNKEVEGERELGLNAGKDGFMTGEEDHFGKGGIPAGTTKRRRRAANLHPKGVTAAHALFPSPLH